MIDLLQKKGGALYFGICMLVFLFFTYSEFQESQFIDIPHIEIPIPPLYIAFFISSVFFLFQILLKKARIDSVSLLLFAFVLIHVINSVYMDVSPKFYAHMITSILSLSTYLIMINMNDDLKYIEKMFFYFFVILLLQIIAESILSKPVEATVYFYKHDMRIPIGASNALSSKLLPFFAFLFSTTIYKWNKILLCVFTFIAIVLLRSRGGFIDFFIVLSILLICSTGKKYFFVFKFLIVPIGLSFLFYQFWDSNLGTLFFSKSDESVISRMELWQSGLHLFEKHPFLGNGFYYETLARNPHNVIIDLIMRSGLVGLIVYGLLFMVLFMKIKRFLNDKSLRGCAIALVALFLHGLVEIVFFTYIYEVIIWTFVGYLVRKSECMEFAYASTYVKDEKAFSETCSNGAFVRL